MNLDFDLSGLSLTATGPLTFERPVSPEVIAVANAIKLNQKIPASSTISSRVPVFIDIETIPDESRRPLFGLDEPVEAPKPFSDPQGEISSLVASSVEQITEILSAFNPSEEWLQKFEAAENSKEKSKPRATVFKLTKSIREARQPKDAEAAEEAKRKKMSLFPEMCRIVCIGIQIGIGGKPLAFVTDDHLGGDVSEIDLLEWAWDCLKSASSVVTYNGIGFDIPAIMARSILLGVRPTRRFDMSPWKDDMCDVMKKRFPAGNQIGMKPLCQMYGIEVPAGDCDGSQVGKLFAAGELKELADYNLSDIYCLEQLYLKMQGFWC